MTLTDIAKALGVHKSTISREIKRNTHHGVKHYYTPSKAHGKARGRLRKPRRTSKLTQEDRRVIEHYLRQDYSPDQIAHAVRLPSGATVSHETIYQAIYRDKKKGGDLHTHLRHRTRKRRKRYRARDSRGRLAGKTMISDRPEHINQRKEIGHWEIDTMVCSKTRKCLLTMTERVTGYSIIRFLKARKAEYVNQAAIAAIRQSTIQVITITADNGSEFHGYKEIEMATKATFYFANPHHSWERGTNENTNGLIRQYVPKKFDMNRLNQAICDKIAYKLNSRPRKRLKYQSPLSYYLAVA